MVTLEISIPIDELLVDTEKPVLVPGFVDAELPVTKAVLSKTPEVDMSVVELIEAPPLVFVGIVTPPE